MSDQDFFFDEEETTPAEAAKPSSKSAGKTAPARSSAPKSTPARTPGPAAQSAPAATGEKQVSLTVAALMTVVGVLLGVIIGFLLPGGGTTATPSTGTPAAVSGTGSTAPQLSEEQLTSGELPAGHPPVESMGGSSETSETTTTGQ